MSNIGEAFQREDKAPHAQHSMLVLYLTCNRFTNPRSNAINIGNEVFLVMLAN